MRCLLQSTSPAHYYYRQPSSCWHCSHDTDVSGFRTGSSDTAVDVKVCVSILCTGRQSHGAGRGGGEGTLTIWKAPTNALLSFLKSCQFCMKARGSTTVEATKTASFDTFNVQTTVRLGKTDCSNNNGSKWINKVIYLWLITPFPSRSDHCKAVAQSSTIFT